METFETFGRLESHLLSVNPLRHVSLHRVPDLQIKFEFMSKQVKYTYSKKNSMCFVCLCLYVYLSTVENREKVENAGLVNLDGCYFAKMMKVEKPDER